MDLLYDDEIIAALRSIRDQVKALSDRRVLPSSKAIEQWIEAVNTRLLPRLMPEFPLVAAICGGGSAGKSTLFNSLVAETVSPVGGRAGINRRLLVALRADYRNRFDITRALLDPFGAAPQELAATDQLTLPGPPLLHFSDALPVGLSLVDTPDFDTGSQGRYQNRKMAEQSLRMADVLVYVFTNANYNNRDNTDFMARMLTAVGTRNCLLVYRTYPAFSQDEIHEHAHTVARNLYGEAFEKHVLGVFRADEDNRVAAGDRSMRVQAVPTDRPNLIETLTQLDPRTIRGELHRSVFSDVLQQGKAFFDAAVQSQTHLELYVRMLRKVQQQCVQDALGHLPMEEVLQRFSEIWQETDPSHVKIMRQAGTVVETPVRLLMRAARWLGRRSASDRLSPGRSKTEAVMQADFVRAANRLRQASLDPVLQLSLPVGDPDVAVIRQIVWRLKGGVEVTEKRGGAEAVGFGVPLPKSLETAQQALRSERWSTVIESLLERQKSLLGFTDRLEVQLRQLVREQRSRMTTMDQVRQTAAAMLNIIPATAAVTYVLHTGDPVGATGIKVKLAGLFGLNDLYALVAIPATTGMKKADLKQLETLLAPVAKAWLTHKLNAVETLFEETISGVLFQRGQADLETSTRLVTGLESNLNRCRRVLEKDT